MKTSSLRKTLTILLSICMMLSMSVPAYAAKINSNNAAIGTPGYLLTTAYGSAGPDFFGVTNTNYDFLSSHTTDDDFNRLAIWGTGVNENANPYYQNLLANSQGSASSGGINLNGIIDSTNIWTQMATISKMAKTVDETAATDGKVTRYDNGSATLTAVNYERAIKGQMLYIASKLDAADGNPDAIIQTANKKNVAYLYAIKEDTAYFFVPGTDTDGSNDCFSNNATISMGYMAVLPFVTNTFDSGRPANIVMNVGGVEKNNPACIVTEADTNALADVDIIIYNTNTMTETGMNGNGNGCNSSGVYNTAKTDRYNHQSMGK